ncbi:hypothetical protein ROT00_07510 [Agromyces mediolanus]|uniref:hypothetical protein n=1 Tax=Agromyces mediolanus TaxID=41986 RepID=UPI0038393D22
MRDTDGRTPYSDEQLMRTVSRHTLWCWQTAGLPLDRETLLSTPVIDESCMQVRGLSAASRGNVRSQLLRVAEALLPAVRQRLAPLPPAEPSAPYTTAQLTSFRSWAAGQPTAAARQSAATLISLGAGAGLAARELAAVLPEDVIEDDEGVLVQVRGERERTVPLLQSWEELLLETRSQALSGRPLFRPTHGKFYPNIVTNFVARSDGIGLKPQSPRLRATWLVTLLTAGTPPQALLDAAGVASLEALTRFLAYVPATDATRARFAFRHAELQGFG